MPDGFMIRPATPEDAEAVTNLLAAAYPMLLAPSYEAELLARALPLMTRANPALLRSGAYYLAVAGWRGCRLRRLDLAAAGSPGGAGRSLPWAHPAFRHASELEPQGHRPRSNEPLRNGSAGGRRTPFRMLCHPLRGAVLPRAWLRHCRAHFREIERRCRVSPQATFPCSAFSVRTAICDRLCVMFRCVAHTDEASRATNASVSCAMGRMRSVKLWFRQKVKSLPRW